MLRSVGFEADRSLFGPSDGVGVVTMVPGTMLILSSRARVWYLETYWSAVWAIMANLWSFGTQDVRWYSGRTAREAPSSAARRIWVDAVSKFASGSRGFAKSRVRARKLPGTCRRSGEASSDQLSSKTCLPWDAFVSAQP